MALSDIPRRAKSDKASFGDSLPNKKYSVAILLIDSLSQLSFTRWLLCAFANGESVLKVV